MSSQSSIPLWGQAWTLTVKGDGMPTTTISSTTWEPPALRVTFDVLQAMNRSPIWYADISIYNLTADTINLFIAAAATGSCWATLSAGFQTGPNVQSIIWNGPVYQLLYTRENVVDQKLTLHCVAIPNGANLLPQAFSVGPFFSQYNLISKMVQAANLPMLSTGPNVVTLGAVASQRMNAVQYPRGNTVFGTLPAYLAQTAAGNGLQTWLDGVSAYVSEVDNGGVVTPNLIYAPPFPPGGDQPTPVPVGTTESVIGTPEQTQEGVNFTVLLDPRLKVGLPPLLVQLVRTQITQLQRTPYVGNAPLTVLGGPDGSNLTFFVTQVRHTGDTRGNVWQTDVTGWSTAYASTLLSSFGVG